MSNYKFGFFDNQLIGVDNLNEITSRLVSGGISAVYSGVDFNVSDINNSNKAVLTGGVVPESDLSLKVTSLGDGYYLINPGLCFFDNGTTMEILSGGERVSVLYGTTRYIYLVSDANKMECFVEVAEKEKQSGEFVLLAVVNADGTITDKRAYAKGRVPGFYASSEGMSINISETYRGVRIFSGENLEIPVGEGNFKHLLIVAKYYPGEYPEAAKQGGLFYCDIENNVGVNYVVASSEPSNGNVIYYNKNLGSAGFNEGIKIQDGKLLLPVSGNINDGYSVIFYYHLW